MKTKKHTIETHDKFQLVTDFVDGTAISTILLYTPFRSFADYETCIFYPNGDSRVVELYESEGKARAGHAKWVDETATKED